MMESLPLYQQRTSPHPTSLSSAEDGDLKDVTLMGGSPWGFSLKGGSEMRSALIISKVSVKLMNH